MWCAFSLAKWQSDHTNKKNCSTLIVYNQLILYISGSLLTKKLYILSNTFMNKAHFGDLSLILCQTMFNPPDVLKTACFSKINLLWYHRVGACFAAAWHSLVLVWCHGNETGRRDAGARVIWALTGDPACSSLYHSVTAESYCEHLQALLWMYVHLCVCILLMFHF